MECLLRVHLKFTNNFWGYTSFYLYRDPVDIKNYPDVSGIMSNMTIPLSFFSVEHVWSIKYPYIRRYFSTYL